MPLETSGRRGTTGISSACPATLPADQGRRQALAPGLRFQFVLLCEDRASVLLARRDRAEVFLHPLRPSMHALVSTSKVSSSSSTARYTRGIEGTSDCRAFHAGRALCIGYPRQRRSLRRQTAPVESHSQTAHALTETQTRRAKESVCASTTTPRLPTGTRRDSGVAARRSCQTRRQRADTKRTHQKRHARRLATHPRCLIWPDLQEKL
jgi:hypothetical protein